MPLLVTRFKSSTTSRLPAVLKLGPAAISNQNPIFEMASNKKKTGKII